MCCVDLDSSDMRIIVITGMSGAGKSVAANILEDMGYFCIDNLPADLLPGLIESCKNNKKETTVTKKLALVMDVRSMRMFGDIANQLRDLQRKVKNTSIFFLEAADQVLLARYRLSRRNHPLLSYNRDLSLSKAISQERLRLTPLREISNVIIDTSEMQSPELNQYLTGLVQGDTDNKISIFIQSFGFKYGIPMDCDNILDVRFIKNPYYIDALRPLSGLDAEIVEYINQFPAKQKFIDVQLQFYKFALPLYQKEGKRRLAIGIGCSGGRHRSVAITEEIAKRLKDLGYRVWVDHRDLQNEGVI